MYLRCRGLSPYMQDLKTEFEKRFKTWGQHLRDKEPHKIITTVRPCSAVAAQKLILFCTWSWKLGNQFVMILSKLLLKLSGDAALILHPVCRGPNTDEFLIILFQCFPVTLQHLITKLCAISLLASKEQISQRCAESNILHSNVSNWKSPAKLLHKIFLKL